MTATTRTAISSITMTMAAVAPAPIALQFPVVVYVPVVVVMCLQMHGAMNTIALHTLNQTAITDKLPVSDFEWEANYSSPYFQQNGQCKVTNRYSYVHQWHSQAWAYPGPGLGNVGMCLANPFWQVHAIYSSMTTAMGTTTMKDQVGLGGVHEATQQRNGTLRSVNRQVRTYTFQKPLQKVENLVMCHAPRSS